MGNSTQAKLLLFKQLKPDGKVTGSIESEEFVIEAKGIFEGNSLVKTSLSEKLKDKKEDFIEKEDIQ